jgi:hypothetical protein
MDGNSNGQDQGPGPSRSTTLVDKDEMGPFHLSVSFKKKRVRVRVHRDAPGESSDSDASPTAHPFQEEGTKIGEFLRHRQYTCLDNQTEDRSVPSRYWIKGFNYKSYKFAEGPTSNMVLLECDQRPGTDCHAVAFISMGAAYTFGIHQCQFTADD